MFPLYKTWADLGILNTLHGLTISLAGVQIGYFCFLYVGFIKSVPREMEESALIDGASQYIVLFLVLFFRY